MTRQKQFLYRSMYKADKHSPHLPTWPTIRAKLAFPSIGLSAGSTTACQQPAPSSSICCSKGLHCHLKGCCCDSQCTVAHIRAARPAYMHACMHACNRRRHLQGEVRSPGQLLLQRRLAVQPQSGVSRVGVHPRADLAHHLQTMSSQVGRTARQHLGQLLQASVIHAASNCTTTASVDMLQCTTCSPGCSTVQLSGGHQHVRRVAANVPEVVLRWVAAGTADVSAAQPGNQSHPTT